MFCRTYSVLTVLCITCLLIFSKLDGDLNFMLALRRQQQKLGSISNGSLLYLVDTELPSDTKGYPYPQDEESGKVVDGYRKQEMDNNNSHDEMGSPEKKDKTPVKTPTSSTSEDVDDGKFTGQFNIKLLNDHLKKCIREKDQEVDMDEYIRIFQQLYKFFCMLGTVFGFIGSDVKSKIEILQGYREGSNKIHYETVEKMIAYEKSTDYINTNKASSGSRTFLRLHRSLIFVSIFLGKMESLEDSDGTSRVCKDAYAQTLAKFHPWLIQKGAGLAMLGLPTKKDLIDKVCLDGVVECNEVVPIMRDVIQLTNEIYNKCENLYTQNDLHGLP